VRILLWHVHGSWTEAFVRGPHRYLLPVTPGRDGDGLGRLDRCWPSTVECPYQTLRDTDVDLVLLQRPKELQLAEDWLGRRPGVDVPAVYVEHNTPRGDVPDTRHHLADRADIPIVHVTGFNDLLWDNGRAPSTVIEHGIPDPGLRFTGELARAAVASNEPIRRWRVTGTDLIPRFVEAGVPVDVFGMRTAGLAERLGVAVTEYDDSPQPALHDALVRRRCYLHLTRWTSLGLSLIEAMQLGLPVVVLGSTEALEAVPPGAGVVSTHVGKLVDAARALLADRSLAAEAGRQARAAAVRRYGLTRFLSDWDRLLEELVR
jgi:glycosyltransferase involved in cell wall biosynthesis